MVIIPPTDRWDVVEARIWYQVDIRWYKVVGRIRVGTQASSGI